MVIYTGVTNRLSKIDVLSETAVFFQYFFSILCQRSLGVAFIAEVLIIQKRYNNICKTIWMKIDSRSTKRFFISDPHYIVIFYIINPISYTQKPSLRNPFCNRSVRQQAPGHHKPYGDIKFRTRGRGSANKSRGRIKISIAIGKSKMEKK